MDQGLEAAERVSDRDMPSFGPTASHVALRAFDWSATPLGPRAAWPAALTAVHELMLASPLAMCAGWGPDLTLLYNAAYTEFLAGRHPGALGRPIAAVWDDVWAQIGPLIARAMAGEQVHHVDMHLVMTRKGHAEDTYWTFAYSPLRDGERVAGFINIATETTAGVLAGQRRDAAEATLRDLNATLEQQVAERTQDRNLIWQLSRELLAVTDDRGRLLRVNPAWTRVLGWGEQDLVGRTSEWLEHPDDRAKTRDVTAKLAELRTDIAIENRIRGADGRYRTLAWTAVPIDGHFYCSGRDVTEERLQTAAIVEQTSQLRRFRDIIQASEAPICAFDTDYRLTAFNRAHSDEFYRIFARRVQLGDVFPDLFPPDQAAVMRGFMARALRGEAYTVTEEFGDPELVKPYWEVTYSPLRDPEGRIIGAFHYAKDISARLRAEAELAAIQDTLRQSQKMEAVGQLTGGVAHDFNNLLTVIKSSSDLLKRPDLAPERRARYVAAISDTVDRAAKLTSQLLAFARRQALKPEVFPVADSVRSLADMMGTLTGARVRITTALPDGPCFVNADASQFDTALVNLAVNARDAMNGEGRIAIAVRAVDAIPAIRAHASLRGPYVAISIGDTGAGIPADIIDRIFEPFFTTKETGKGTGLGLSQVFGFAKQSGGDITVESVPGAGTTFTLYLPRVGAPERAAAVAEPSHGPVDGHGTRVLVVEDNPNVGSFTVQSLSDLGYATVLAADGASALAELARDAGRFDVVFSDVVMPGMSGIELGQEIRRLYRDMPVVLASGYSHVLAQNGTYGFELLHKPYSVEELSQMLRKAVSWSRRRTR